MKQLVLIFLCFLTSSQIFAQFDTILDYKERFFINDSLITKNKLIDTLKDGLWVEYFDKKWNSTSKSSHKYYRLIEYENGLPLGKVYDFYKSGQLQMMGEYLSLNPETRIGTFVWYDRRGRKESLKYYSDEDQYEMFFNKNQTISSYKHIIYGKDRNLYDNHGFNYKNGRPRWIIYWNKEQDSSYYQSSRRNGSLETLSVHFKGHYIHQSHNKKNKLKSKSYRISGNDTTFFEKYKDEKLIEKSYIINGNNIKYVQKYKNGYPIGNLIVEENFYKYASRNDTIKYFQNDTVLTYLNSRSRAITTFSKNQFKEEINKNKRRNQRIIYLEYLSDSTLLLEIFYTNKGIASIYREYYRNGNLKTYGFYDKRGRMDGGWKFYEEDGTYTKFQWYKKGLPVDKY
jgi:hypothetical protein